MTAPPVSEVLEPATDLSRFLDAIWQDGEVREMRAPKQDGVASGFFDNRVKLAHKAGIYDGKTNLYLTINPVKPELLARSPNMLLPRVKTGFATSDGDIVRRRWLPLDIDPRRKANTSATEEEREAALALARVVVNDLTDKGWPLPLTAMSGNGYLLLYPIDLPNDEASKQLVHGVLQQLGKTHDNDAAHIDTSVGNAARIVCLVGTMKVKGEDSDERPHRRSELVLLPEPGLVTHEQLTELWPSSGAREPVLKTESSSMPEGWVRDLLDLHAVAYRAPVRREDERGGVTWYPLFVCPFHDDTPPGDDDCGVGEADDGRAVGHCFHDRGADKHWQDFKEELGLVVASAGVVLHLDATRLPDAFWGSRPYLQAIRQAARSRQLAPDAVFGAVLARVAAALPHKVGLPAIIGNEVGTGLLVALVGPSGFGKSGAASLADDLLVGGPEVYVIPGGSNEGLSEAFFEWVPGLDGKGKVKEQTRHNVYAYIDEGEKSMSIASRPGGDFSAWRQAFGGKTLGEQNATQERRRVVPPGSYAIGIVIGFQEDVIGPLFDDLGTGTPQRFLYFGARDLAMPDVAPDWPAGDVLPWPLPDPSRWVSGLVHRSGIRRYDDVFGVAEPVRETIRRDHRERNNEADPDTWAAHRNLLRLKTADALAWLDGRGNVEVSDWELAGMVVDVSDAVRRATQAVLAAGEAQVEQSSIAKAGRRAVGVDDAVAERGVQRVVERIVDAVKTEPGALSRGALYRRLASRDRDFFDEAYGRADKAKRIEERIEPGQGEPKVRLWPGRRSL